MAAELGEMLEWCGGSDLTIQKDVSQKELQLFAEAVGAGLRGPKGGAAYSAPSPKIRLRPVTDAARFRGLEIEQLSFEQKVVRTYASAVVIMRRFFADLQASRYILPATHQARGAEPGRPLRGFDPGVSRRDRRPKPELRRGRPRRQHGDSRGVDGARADPGSGPARADRDGRDDARCRSSTGGGARARRAAHAR